MIRSQSFSEPVSMNLRRASQLFPHWVGQDGCSCSLSLMLLDFVKRVGQLLRRMPLSSDLSNASS